jgi:hypothetical protein
VEKATSTATVKKDVMARSSGRRKRTNVGRREYFYGSQIILYDTEMMNIIWASCICPNSENFTTQKINPNGD